MRSGTVLSAVLAAIGPCALVILFHLPLLGRCQSAAAQENDALRPRPISTVEHWELELPAHHVQGLSVSPKDFWISTVDRRARKGWVFRVDRESLKVVASRDVTLGAQYHPGGIQEIKGTLWVPVAEYRPKSTTTILKLDAQTLETISSFAVDDHLGATASDGEEKIWGLNWDSRQVYFFDLTGKLIEKRDNPTGVAYQDIDYCDGMLYACGAKRIDERRIAVVDGLEPKTLELQTRYELRGKSRDGDSNFSREGFAKLYGDFYLLPEDGPQSTVYRFPLPQQ